MDVELTWGAGTPQPHAAVSLTLQPLQLQLRPEHPTLLAHLAACVSASLPDRTNEEQAPENRSITGALLPFPTPRRHRPVYKGVLRRMFSLVHIIAANYSNTIYLVFLRRDVAVTWGWPRSSDAPLRCTICKAREDTKLHREPNIAGDRSLLEELMMPDYSGLAASMLSASGTSWHSAAGGWGRGSCSLEAGSGSYPDPSGGVGATFGSVRSGLAGLVSSTAEALQSLAGGAGDAAPRPPRPMGWAFWVTTSSISVVLFYPDAVSEPHTRQWQRTPAGGAAAECGSDGEGISSSPRISLECTDMEVQASGGGNTGARVQVRLHRLEAAEHLPGTQEEAAELSDAAAVPAVLPPAPGACRPQPSFCGAVPGWPSAALAPSRPRATAAPGVARSPAHRLLYSSTLSQLSFMSASGTLDRSALAASAIGGSSESSMLVRSLLCCGSGSPNGGGGSGGDSSDACLVLTVELPAPGALAVAVVQRAGRAPGAVSSPAALHAKPSQLLVDVVLTPVSLWASFALLQRLQEYAEAVMPQPAAPASGGVQPPHLQAPSAADSARSAAQRAIDSIVCDMEVRATCPDPHNPDI